MRAIAKVMSINGNVARVVSKRSSACESCHNCENKGECHAMLVFGEQKQEIQLDVKNDVGAKVGDTVELESSTPKTLLVCMLIFILPVLASFLTYIVTDYFFDDAVKCALALLLSFVLCFFIVVKVVNSYVKKNLNSYIVKILQGDIE